MTADERFDAKWEPRPASGCHEWLASLSTAGYGKFGLNGVSMYAHRFAYEREHGPIPEGLVIHHRCENRRCVNPEHLEAKSRHDHLHGHDNTLPALNAAKTHCPHGHLYDRENTQIDSAGGRHCRACWRIQARTRRRVRAMERVAA